MILKILILVVVIIACIPDSYGADVKDVEKAWDAHKEKHKLSYSSADHESQRKKNFAAAHEIIEKHNSNPNATYKMAHNHLSHKSESEKKTLRGYKKVNHHRVTTTRIFSPAELRALPASVDYRTHKCMQPVRDQGNCGSCYAFAAIATLEFASCIKSGKAVALSEQQIVDCSASYGNLGCNGGYPTHAWAYIAGVGGSDTASYYPYASGSSGSEGACKFSGAYVGAKVKATSSPATWANSATFIKAGDTVTMQTVIANNGTVSVGIYSSPNLDYYASGVFSDSTCGTNDVDHAVTIVGYGTLNSIPYWIVRNSFSSDWGLAGYALFKRGVNMCSIESEAVYTTVV